MIRPTQVTHAINTVFQQASEKLKEVPALT